MAVRFSNQTWHGLPKIITASARHGHSGSADCVPIALANAYVERLIGSIRRECLDHMIVFGEAHLRRILGAYAAYYPTIMSRGLIGP